MTRKITVVSGKGGVGKTTVCYNLGRALCKMKKKVLLIDADFSLNNLELTMDSESFSPFDLFDVLNGRCRLKQALIVDNHEENLFLLRSNKMSATSDYDSNRIKAVLSSYERLFDYIFIDAPSGIGEGFSLSIELGTEALVVTCIGESGIRDADKVINLLETEGVETVGIVLNKVRGDLIVKGKMLSVEETEVLLKNKVLGVIPDDDGLLLEEEKYVSKRTKTAFNNLARAISKNEIKLLDVKKPYYGFLGRIRASFKLKW